MNWLVTELILSRYLLLVGSSCEMVFASFPFHGLDGVEASLTSSGRARVRVKDERPKNGSEERKWVVVFKR